MRKIYDPTPPQEFRGSQAGSALESAIAGYQVVRQGAGCMEVEMNMDDALEFLETLEEQALIRVAEHFPTEQFGDHPQPGHLKWWAACSDELSF